jgi:tetratricopeptide (TPR) repeat protein
MPNRVPVTANHIVTSVTGFLKAYNAAPTSAAGLLAGGKIAEIGHDLAQAQLLYVEALAADPNCYEALARLAISYMKTAELPGALQCARKLVADSPTGLFHDLGGVPISSFTVLADVLRLAGKSAEAKDAYQEALKHEPAKNYAAGYLAALHLTAGELAEALSLKDSILELARFDELISILGMAAKQPANLPALISVSRAMTTRADAA